MDDLEFDKYIDSLINNFEQENNNNVVVDYISPSPAKVEKTSTEKSYQPIVQKEVKKDGEDESEFKRKLLKLESQVEQLSKALILQDQLAANVEIPKMVTYGDNSAILGQYKEKVDLLEYEIKKNKKSHHDMVSKIRQQNLKVEKSKSEIDFLKMQSNLSECEITKLSRLITDLRYKNEKLGNLARTLVKENAEIRNDFAMKRETIEKKIRNIIQLMNNEG